MDRIVQKITSDSQEVKEAAEVLQQVKSTDQQTHKKIQGKLGMKAIANEVEPLSNIENIRRGSDPNHIAELGRSRYNVESEQYTDLGEYYIGVCKKQWKNGIQNRGRDTM